MLLTDHELTCIYTIGQSACLYEWMNLNFFLYLIFTEFYYLTNLNHDGEELFEEILCCTFNRLF